MPALSRSLPLLFGVAAAALPRVAHACPMCFNGADSNSQAFVYGSLFLMIVPVTAIGSLAYWAFRRIQAAENASPGDQELEEALAETQPPAGGVVLQMRPGSAPPHA